MGAEIISNVANNIKSGVYSCMPLPDEEPQSILEFFFAVDSSGRVAVNQVPQAVCLGCHQRCLLLQLGIEMSIQGAIH